MTRQSMPQTLRAPRTACSLGEDRALSPTLQISWRRHKHQIRI